MLHFLTLNFIYSNTRDELESFLWLFVFISTLPRKRVEKSLYMFNAHSVDRYGFNSLNDVSVELITGFNSNICLEICPSFVEHQLRVQSNFVMLGSKTILSYYFSTIIGCESSYFSLIFTKQNDF